MSLTLNASSVSSLKPVYALVRALIGSPGSAGNSGTQVVLSGTRKKNKACFFSANWAYNLTCFQLKLPSEIRVFQYRLLCPLSLIFISRKEYNKQKVYVLTQSYNVDINGMLLGLVEWLMVARIWCTYVGWFVCSYSSGTRGGYPGNKLPDSRVPG